MFVFDLGLTEKPHLVYTWAKNRELILKYSLYITPLD